jgi:lysine-N-methylase
MAILHRTRTLQALVPLYVTRFGCIGPQCEDSCCHGWKVDIDKKTYKAYQQSSHPELGPRLSQNVTREKNPSSDLSYAVVGLNPDTRSCSLLEDKLCTVHAKLGDSYLSNTCFSYPRISRSFDGQFEQALMLSCPEAARQALLAPDAFDFVEGSIAVRADVVDQVTSRYGIPVDLMNELRIFCLNLARAEGMELWQRLAVLGVFCESVTKALANGEHASLRPLMDTFGELVAQGLALDALSGMQPNYSAQALVFTTLWQQMTFATPSAVQASVISATRTGLGADSQSAKTDDEKLIEGYCRGVRRLAKALDAAPHLLEHYVLNEMFKGLFPFDGEDPYESYLRLIARFGLLRLMLAAQCNTEGDLPDAAALVQTVQVFCRRFQHDGTLTSRVHQALKSSGLGTLEKVYGFLRA